MELRWKVLAVTALVAAASALVPPAPASAAVDWGACPPEQYGFGRDPRQQCAVLRVPVDYRAPNGPQLDLHVSRIATAQPGLRRGVLVLDAGGPADVGLDYPSFVAARIPQAVRDRYDLIGFDPRGVGYSAPISCGLPTDLPPDVYELVPAADGSIDRTVEVARDIAARCVANVGAALPHITTPNTARDIDRLRAALGEPRISYLGYSYGSYLGAVYRTLFPRRVDRMVLDSAIDPARYGHDQVRLTGLGLELRLPDFFGWAAARHDRYGLGTTAAAVRRTFDTLLARYDAHPLTLPDGTVVNGNLIRLLTFEGVYVDAGMPALAETLGQLAAAAPPASLVTGARVEAAAAAGSIPADNADSMRFAISCNDGAWPRDVATYQRDVSVDRRLFPSSGGWFANVRPCAFWGPKAYPPVPVTGGGSRNVLIVHNLRDPALPWISALGLQKALGSAAVLVSVDQGGHTAYLTTNSVCANDTTTAYLAHGTLPAGPRLCPGQAPPA